MALERSALSWMDRLARKQAYSLPYWRVATAPISEIGGSLLPHISGMNGLLSETSRSSKSAKNAYRSESVFCTLPEDQSTASPLPSRWLYKALRAGACLPT